jgi:predicted permease
LSDYKQGILSGCLFSVTFPFLIISAISSSRELKLPEHGTIVLRIFEPSVTVTDWLMVKIQKFRFRKNQKSRTK